MASTRRGNERVGQHIKLTKTRVDNIDRPANGQAFVRDSEMRGFALRVTAAGAKAFVVEKRINGRVKRITLGRYPDITVEQARKEAQKIIGKIATGTDPIAERKEKHANAVNVKRIFDEFLQERINLRERTRDHYKRTLSRYVKDWLEKPLADITKDMVAKRHREIGEEHGQASANLTMRVLSTIYNFASAKYEDASGRSVFPENPVNRLRQARSWYKEERRQTVIKPHQLPAWYAGVMALKSEPDHSSDVVADYLMLLLLTGLRRGEGISLRWSDIDLADATLRVAETKNREPLVLPLSDYLQDLLHKRYGKTQSEFVFPGVGKTGHLVEPKKQIAKVRESSGVYFTLHDLRRTFITTAESLDISAYAIKRLVNHKMGGDVTAGYIISNVERLREPMQRIADLIIRSSRTD